MADIKITNLPLGVAADNDVVPSDNAAGNTTQKIKLGDISKLSLAGTSANQVVYKNSNNVASGDSNFTFDGTTLRANRIIGGTESVFTGSNSTVGGGSLNQSLGARSFVAGGELNVALSPDSFITGSLNIASSNAGFADSIIGVKDTIKVRNSLRSSFNNTTLNALQIRYSDIFGDNYLTTRTVVSATQNGQDVDLILTSNVGSNTITWFNVTVINTAISDVSHGQTVNGSMNIASGLRSCIGGGDFNLAKGSSATIGGGTGNKILSDQAPSCTIGGGENNSCSSYHNTIGGGIGNTILASGSVGTIGGGSYNEVYGSVGTIGGGSYNEVYGVSGTVSGGSSNNVIGNNGTVSGGSGNTASGENSTITGGSNAIADRYGMRAYSSGSFGNSGDAQQVSFILRNITTNATPSTLTLDGDNSKLVIPNNKALYCTVNVGAIINGGSKSAHYIRKVAIKNTSNTVSLIGSVSSLGTDQEDDPNYDVNITADNVSKSLQINVTGKSSEVIRWVASVDGIEIGIAPTATP